MTSSTRTVQNAMERLVNILEQNAGVVNDIQELSAGQVKGLQGLLTEFTQMEQSAAEVQSLIGQFVSVDSNKAAA